MGGVYRPSAQKYTNPTHIRYTEDWYGSVNCQIPSLSKISADTWHHIAYTFKPLGNEQAELICYYNGVAGTVKTINRVENSDGSDKVITVNTIQCGGYDSDGTQCAESDKNGGPFDDRNKSGYYEGDYLWPSECA
ncbi:MAG: hypothetical protein QGI80_02340, partial [archaeon]|nr:hypothetical protein [archaeon]